MSERKIVRDESGHGVVVPCPGCGRPRVLYLAVLDPAEARAYHERIGWVDVTAAISEPADRQEAMRRSAEIAVMSEAIAWVSCVTCGYEGHYTFGA